MNGIGIETALTFHGTIPEIPDILIDNFQPLHVSESIYNSSKFKPKYCFISHAHSDHYKGLTKQFPRYVQTPLLIMTKTTHDLIVAANASPQTRRNITRCLFPKVNQTIELEKGLECTLIPNFHCLGSCMIFLKDTRNGRDFNMLYSGDARFEDSVISSFKTSPKLLPFIYGEDQLDMLYLDTTFAYRKRNIDILENAHGIYQLIKLIEMYPLGTTFKFTDTVYGFEEVWIKLLDHFGNRCVMYCCEKVQKWLSILKNNTDNESSSLMEKRVNTMDDITTLFKIQHGKNFVNYTDKYNFYVEGAKNIRIVSNGPIVEVKHAIDLTKTEYLSVHSPKKEEEFYDLIYKADPIHKWVGKFSYNDLPLVFEYIKDDTNNLYLPLHIKFIYSRHSSYTETKNFVDLFKQKPKDLYPMTESFNTWQRGFNMLRFYGVANTSYDRNCMENYGSCNIDVSYDKKNIEVVDFWSSIPDEISMHSFNSVSTEVDFDFEAMGQDLRNSGIHTSFDERKDLLVQNEGRKIRRQIEEKKRRTDRFLRNVDTNTIEHTPYSMNGKVALQVVQIVTAKRQHVGNDSVKRPKTTPVDKVVENILTGINFK